MCSLRCGIFSFFLFVFFDFPIFSIYRKWEFSIFLNIVSSTFFCLITHIINLFQTMQIQTGRFKACLSNCHLKNLHGAKLLLRSIYSER